MKFSRLVLISKRETEREKQRDHSSNKYASIYPVTFISVIVKLINFRVFIRIVNHVRDKLSGKTVYTIAHDRKKVARERNLHKG